MSYTSCSMTNLSSIISASPGVSVPCGNAVSAALKDREESASFEVPMLMEESVFSDFSPQPAGKRIKLKVRIKQRDFLKIWCSRNMVIPPLIRKERFIVLYQNRNDRKIFHRFSVLSLPYPSKEVLCFLEFHLHDIVDSLSSKTCLPFSLQLRGR